MTGGPDVGAEAYIRRIEAIPYSAARLVLGRGIRTQATTSEEGFVPTTTVPNMAYAKASMML